MSNSECLCVMFRFLLYFHFVEHHNIHGTLPVHHVSYVHFSDLYVIRIVYGAARLLAPAKGLGLGLV